jgi:hypothetical protein
VVIERLLDLLLLVICQGQDWLGICVGAIRVWLWRPPHVCTQFGPSIQRGTILSTCDSTWRVERAFEGASPSCGETMLVVPLEGWTEINGRHHSSSLRDGRDQDFNGSGPTRAREGGGGGGGLHPVDTSGKIDNHLLSFSLITTYIYKNRWASSLTLFNYYLHLRFDIYHCQFYCGVIDVLVIAYLASCLISCLIHSLACIWSLLARCS